MNNVQTDIPDQGGLLNAADVSFLEDTCSMGNIATLDGIRDCTAFCQHHLCCFSDDPDENCRGEHAAECEAYEACRNLTDGPVAEGRLGPRERRRQRRGPLVDEQPVHQRGALSPRRPRRVLEGRRRDLWGASRAEEVSGVDVVVRASLADPALDSGREGGR